jgi:hypothetical protein
MKFEANVIKLGITPIFSTISHLYCLDFAKTPFPSPISRSMMSILLHCVDDPSIILSHISHFMYRSPANCFAMSKYLDLNHFIPYSIARLKTPQFF